MSGQSLSESFETRYKGCNGVDESDRRRELLKLVESELPVDTALGEESSSQRVFISNKDLYKIYRGLCLAKGEKPGFLFNGRSLISRKEFEELDSDDGTDSEKLRKLWKSIGGDRS